MILPRVAWAAFVGGMALVEWGAAQEAPRPAGLPDGPLVDAAVGLTPVRLPMEVSVDLPRSWHARSLLTDRVVPLDRDAVDLSVLVIGAGPPRAVLTAGPTNGYLYAKATVSIQKTGKDLDGGVQGLGDARLKEFDQLLRSIVEQQLAPQGLPLVAWQGTQKTRLRSGHWALVSEFQRQSQEGVAMAFRVTTVFGPGHIAQLMWSCPASARGEWARLASRIQHTFRAGGQAGGGGE